MQYDIAVIIGRFQPFHLGHRQAVIEACEKADHVLVLLGSCNKAPDIKNPFTFEQRKHMIMDGVPMGLVDRLHFAPLNDYPYSNANWVAQVQGKVYDLVALVGDTKRLDHAKICLVGFKKDHTSGYLSWFPQWAFEPVNDYKALHATDIRDKYFGFDVVDVENTGLGVQQFLESFRGKPEHKHLVDEWKFINNYKKQFEGFKYPPIFVTGDSVVICKGHVLVIKRKAHPGKGLWALPGGFVHQDEWVTDSIIRELQEETKIDVDESVLKSALKGTHVFDHPQRSLRGRTITHAGLFVLHDDDMPWVKGADDAEKAKWMPLNEAYANPQIFFEDHAHIIHFMVNNKVF